MQPAPPLSSRGAEIMKPVGPPSKDNYFAPLCSRSTRSQPLYLVAVDWSARVSVACFTGQRASEDAYARVKFLIDPLIGEDLSFDFNSVSRPKHPPMHECPRCERCYEDEILVCPDDQSKTKHTLPGTTLLSGRYRLDKRLG